MKFLLSSLAVGLVALVNSASAAGIATFDDLPSPPALDGSAGLFFANGSSATYQDVTWDSRFTVVGDAYRVDPLSGPLFGLPRSGHYMVTNQTATVDDIFTNDGLLITTSLVLTEAWFGQNEYYGFGGGADEVTIHALHGTEILGSVSLSLPDDTAGQPEPLRRMDTAAFLAFSGITGYRIDRHPRTATADNWVADDFVFQSAVPEASTAWLVALGLGGIALSRRRT